jgi:hypothetical protein
MKRLDMRLVVGLLLIVAGVFYLLANLSLIRWGGLVWGMGAGVAGLVFLAAVARDRTQWWFLIPGLVLAAIAALSLLDYFAPAWSAAWGGSLFLGSIGVAFWLIYALDRRMWWAIIPGGALLTLAAVAGLDQLQGIEGGGVLFLGLGLTFGLLAIAPLENGLTLRWAYIPAGILLLMGTLLLFGFSRAMGYIWPAALILGGLLLLTRAWRTRPS